MHAHARTIPDVYLREVKRKVPWIFFAFFSSPLPRSASGLSPRIDIYYTHREGIIFLIFAQVREGGRAGGGCEETFVHAAVFSTPAGYERRPRILSHPDPTLQAGKGMHLTVGSSPLASSNRHIDHR
jgi:hypothetical protein